MVNEPFNQNSVSIILIIYGIYLPAQFYHDHGLYGRGGGFACRVCCGYYVVVGAV